MLELLLFHHSKRRYIDAKLKMCGFHGNIFICSVNIHSLTDTVLTLLLLYNVLGELALGLKLQL